MKVRELFEDIDLTGTIYKSSLLINKLSFLNDTINVDGRVDLIDLPTNTDFVPWHFGKVTQSYDCSNNFLKSLENAPIYVGSDFGCTNNDLTSLDHCPPYIGGWLLCSDNKISSLIGIHKQLKHCKHIVLNDNPIEEGGLGLLLIDGLEKIDTDHPALQIIAKYVGQGKKGMMLCQAELIENGYEAFAKL